MSDSPTPSEELPVDGRDTRGRFADGNLAALKHGARSSQTLDRLKTEAAEALAVQRAEIERDLGGSEELSRITRDLVARYLEVDLIANYLADNVQRLGPLTGKGRTRAAVTTYLQALDRQVRLAERLGLDRRTKPAQTIEGYLATKAAAAQEAV